MKASVFLGLGNIKTQRIPIPFPLSVIVTALKVAETRKS
jgi:hypothetical protein